MSEVTPIPNSAPMGGSELILGHLTKALPELTSQVQIIVSRPEQVTHDPDKPKVLWLQDLPHDPASQCLKDPEYRKKFNRIVFVSHWQQQMYNAFLGIPFSEGTVIKNGVPRFSATLPKLRIDANGVPKLQFIYTSTPHRGLGLLAAAAAELAKVRQDWELHVYSSFNIYGWHEQDKQFQPLYEKLKENPCVVYHGSQPNDVVREALTQAHVFIYPSIYAETSCMAIQEAMMAGCLAITTNYGALPETCGEWAWMMRFSENFDHIVYQTLTSMERAFEKYDTPFVQNILQMQALYFQTFWAFEQRVPQWERMLTDVVAEAPRVEMFVIE